MPLDALGLVLLAACLHALWNVLLAGSPDVQAATGTALAVAVVAFAPIAAATWRVEAEAWPFIARSAELELGYLLLLAAPCCSHELSVGSPAPSSLVPALGLPASAAFLGTGSSAGEVVGVALVACGVVVVRGLRRGAARTGFALAAGVACFIASYTLVDRYGVMHANPLTYLELVFLPVAVLYLLAPGRARTRAALRPAVVVSGLAMFGGYTLVLLALRLASAASVAAVRESSVVIAVVLAALLLHEPVGQRRLAGAVAVAAGVAL